MIEAWQSQIQLNEGETRLESPFLYATGSLPYWEIVRSSASFAKLTHLATRSWQ